MPRQTFPRNFQGTHEAMLAIGDSWFWYPNNNLIEAIVALPELKDDFRSICLLGENGASLASYRVRPEWRDELRPQNFRYSVVLVSGCGNDVVDYSLALKANCAKITDPKKCFDENKLRTMIDDVVGNISAIIFDVQMAAKRADIRTPKILLNGYDYPPPDGRPFAGLGSGEKFKFGGPWLKPKFDRAQVKDDLVFRTDVMAYLIDTINDALEHVANQVTGVKVVRQAGTLNRPPKTNYKSDWANELHPTRSGFSKLVRACWLQQLRAVGAAV